MSSPYYSDDFVKLYLDDCRECASWLACDVLVTDPPYGIRWTGIATSYSRGVGRSQRQPDIEGDRDTSVRDMVLSMWGGRPAIVFGSWRAPRPPGVRHRLIWDKQGMAPGPACMPFMTMDEEIYVLGEGYRPSAPPSEVRDQHSRGAVSGSAGNRAPDTKAGRPHGAPHLPLSRRGCR